MATSRPDPTELFGSFVRKYYKNPIGFVREVLQVDPDEWQCEVMAAVAKGERKISIRSGHGTGKTTVLSWISIWHMLTRYPQKTVATAPTSAQLFDALFSEILMWVRRLPDYLKSLLETFSDRIELKASPEASFLSVRTSSRDKPEALQGIHSEHVLLLIDEASGVDEKVFEAAAGSMSGENACTLMIGNPTRLSGMFFLSHHRLSTEWRTFHVSSLISRRVSKSFISEIANTYGPDSNAYRIRVLGEFPSQADDSLIALDDVVGAQNREITIDPGAPLVYGVDVARFGGDRNTLIRRKGRVVLAPLWWNGIDLMATVARVMQQAEIDAKDSLLGPPAEICVDVIGVGAGVADRLRQLSGADPDPYHKGPKPFVLKANIIDVNVSELGARRQDCHRLRDELWIEVRDWLLSRAVKLPNDSIPGGMTLKEELVAPTYTLSMLGKYVVEAKSDMKSRGLRSPDLADGLALTFASQAAAIGGYGQANSQFNWNEPIRRGRNSSNF